PLAGARPWPAPDGCWQALARLGIERLDGCVLVSAQPRQLQAGLNAGLWTIGLAASGPSCGLSPADWDALGHTERDRLRADTTLELYRLGVHSVIDHLGELQPCLHDLAVRRLKGEKP
ncbi:TPA: HAD family phosphatase, partial [Pseudomonas aeruginosa]|nr:HAD family phosphatase [Pseudomonas aeruginosa]